MRVVLVGILVVTAACGDAEPPAVDAAVKASVVQDLDAVVMSAIEAHRTGDYDRAVELSLQAEAMLPNHPRLLFNTACALALSGDTEAALDRLERIAAMQYAVDLEASASMAPLRDQPRFDGVLRAMAAITEPIEKSTVAFTVPDRTFLVEGVAHDPATGDLFLSSLYLRRIARVTPEGEMVAFTEPSKDLWSMLGMVVDSENGRLWSITVGGPRMQNAAKDEPLQSALVEFSLIDGSEIARFDAPSDIEGTALDSLAVGGDGAVYVSDSGAGAIHRLRPGGKRLEAMVPPGTFLSTQGLELSADGSILYAADYGRGVAAVDVESGEVRFLEHDGPCLLGIDGLERHGDDLIAIQNGIQPPRVVRIVLGPDGDTITAVETLERAHHLYREPTLGTVVGDDLIYVAASQWRSFDADGTLLVDQLVEPTILRLPLTE
jgi:sugar lactone lactonase YvrE